MDSLPGIPVEYELDTFNTPPQEQLYVTPKIGYVNAMLLLRFRHLALSSHLGHFHGDQLTPLHQTHKNHGDSKVHFPPTATFRLYTHNLAYRLAAQTQTKFSMLQIKTIPKNISTIGILLHHSLLLFLTTLGEEATQRNTHTHVTPSSSLNTNKYFPRITTKPCG